MNNADTRLWEVTLSRGVGFKIHGDGGRIRLCTPYAKPTWNRFGWEFKHDIDSKRPRAVRKSLEKSNPQNDCGLVDEIKC
ncbi:MAG: hypothetical protein VYA30_14065 [Myxococcota bacterium]|nr:hypothetical protein [Myxococcota bacterium]